MSECRHPNNIRGCRRRDHYTLNSCIHLRKAGLLTSGRSGGLPNQPLMPLPHIEGAEEAGLTIYFWSSFDTGFVAANTQMIPYQDQSKLSSGSHLNAFSICSMDGLSWKY